MEKNNVTLKKWIDLSYVINIFLFSFIIFFLLFAPFLTDRFGFGISLSAYQILETIYESEPGSSYALGTLFSVLLIYGLFIYSIVILVLEIKNFLNGKEFKLKIHTIILIVLVLVILILTSLTEISSNANNTNLGAGVIAIIVFSLLLEIILCLFLFLYPRINFEKLENDRENQKNSKQKSEPKNEVYYELEKLKELKDKGILTDEEYEAKRKDLVAKL